MCTPVSGQNNTHFRVTPALHQWFSKVYWVENKDKKIRYLWQTKVVVLREIQRARTTWVKELVVFQVFARCICFLKSPICSNRHIMFRHEQPNPKWNEWKFLKYTVEWACIHLNIWRLCFHLFKLAIKPKFTQSRFFFCLSTDVWCLKFSHLKRKARTSLTYLDSLIANGHREQVTSRKTGNRNCFWGNSLPFAIN